MSVGSLFYGNSLVREGVPCDTRPFTAAECVIFLILFWGGALVLGVSVVVVFYWRLFRYRKEKAPSKDSKPNQFGAGDSGLNVREFTY